SWLYTGIGAVTVGSLFAAFEIIKEWGNTRTIKGTGKIFKDNYLTAALMAEISHEILLSRLLIQRLAQMFTLEENDNKNKEEKLYITSLSTVAHVTAAAEKAINNIMELMGSAGYATEWNLERYWRDVKTMQVHLGNWELNKMELAQYFYESKILQPEGS
ncbi:MAG: acyl-CoA/acyl-ACP dehydrogenase, partial [Firmicutes bacterium]|nr:acyl-CoA/acyl-ACP dehydrogenase [Bacillota bacterium]